MEKTETKSAIQTALGETAESVKKVRGELRRLAGNAADSSRHWARLCGERISDGARFASLRARQTSLRRRLERAHEELGRAVYALHEEEGGERFVGAPGLEAALQRVEEADATSDANRAELAALREKLARGDSTSA
jgi:hypothetical protein